MKFYHQLKNTVVILLVAFTSSHIAAQPAAAMPDSFSTSGNTSRAGSVVAFGVLSFTGSSSNGQNTLTWKTGYRSGFTRFILERSPDMKSFSAIGDVAASGGNSFTFVDKQPIAGRNNYRLKMIDSSGAATYSVAMLIITAPAGNGQIQYEAGSGTINISGITAGNPCQLKVYNSSGQLLLQKTANSEQPAISISSLPHGLYVVYVTDGVVTPISRKIIW